MSQAAKIAQLYYERKPTHTPYKNYFIQPEDAKLINSHLNVAIVDAAYAAILTYSEALNGIKTKSSSWSIIRLYYSCYFCIKTLLLLNDIIAFHSNRKEMLLYVSERRFLSGGRSSHHWNWNSFLQTQARTHWFCSEDSQSAYENLRKYREKVNYNEAFTDPQLHHCLSSVDVEVSKRFRTYRDDSTFTYTYLEDHFSIAYPTKLITALANELTVRELTFDPERKAHLRSVWKFKDRCPIL